MTQTLVFCNCNRARSFICSILNLKQSLNLKPQVHINNTKSWPLEICLCLYARKTNQILGSNDFLKFNWKIDAKFVEVASVRMFVNSVNIFLEKYKGVQRGSSLGSLPLLRDLDCVCVCLAI